MADPIYLPTPGEIAHILRDGDDYRDPSPHRRCVHGCCGYAVINEHQAHSHSDPPETCDLCLRREARYD